MKPVLFTLLFAFTSLTAATTYPPLSDAEMTAYQEEIDQELANSQKKIDDLFTRMGSEKKVLTANDKNAVKQASTDLAAKKILVGNLMGTDVIERSPAVRAKLLEIIKKDNISPEDLISLQDLINSEKEKIRTSDLENQPPAPQATETSPSSLP